MVEHPHIPAGYGPERQLLLAGDAELADNVHIEGRVKGLGHLIGDDDAPAGKPEDDHVGLALVCSQSLGERPPGISAIGEDTHLRFSQSVWRLRRRPAARGGRHINSMVPYSAGD